MNPNNKYNKGGGGGTNRTLREELQHKLQHIENNPRNTETLSDSKNPPKKKYYLPNKLIPEFIKIKGMPKEDWQALANQFCDADLVEALQETKSHTKLFGLPRNLAAFITKKCQKYILKRNKK